MKHKKTTNVDNFAKDIAKQPNEFTSAVFRGSAMSYRLIIFALFKTAMKQNAASSIENRRCTFTQNEFCSKLGIPLGSKTEQLIERAIDELTQSFIILINPNTNNSTDIKNSRILWFQRIDTLKNGDITFTFNEEIAKHFQFKVGYTALELLEIGSLQSFYAMRYYSLAKSKSGFSGKENNEADSWWFEYTEDELRLLFGIEDGKYKDRRDFVKYVIKQPCEEVCIKTSITIALEQTKITKGKYRWRFVCSTKLGHQLEIKASDNEAVRREKREINAERAKIAAYEAKYPEQFEAMRIVIRAKNTLPFPRLTIDEDAEIAEALEKQGLML